MFQILPEYHCKQGRVTWFSLNWSCNHENFCKLEPKVVHYRNYKNFTNKLFSENLVNQLSVTEVNTNDSGFGKLERHASPNKKYIRGNQSSFMIKTLSKEIKKKTKLRNNLLKNRTEEKRDKYSKQRNVYDY